ncbi:hypothetical protein PVAG01_04197 [Phlyctema vagabunda]|uniref:Uncharacterized protein n=1 Tax=Phlyctema vagabunda TaxID=108571 RepID=A0ABR4PNM6_9HELO
MASARYASTASNASEKRAYCSEVQTRTVGKLAELAVGPEGELDRPAEQEDGGEEKRAARVAAQESTRTALAKSKSKSSPLAYGAVVEEIYRPAAQRPRSDAAIDQDIPQRDTSSRTPLDHTRKAQIPRADAHDVTMNGIEMNMGLNAEALDPSTRNFERIRSAISEENTTWKEWEKTNLPSALQCFGSPRATIQPEQCCDGSDFYHERLDFTFRAGQYYRVHLRLSPGQEVLDYIVLVHTFVESKQSADSAQMVVTKYSPATRIPGCGHFSSDARELVLHFTKYSDMSNENDAELIEMDDIVQNLQNNAVSHMPEFPLVYDMTSNILGASEGFSQANFDISAGFTNYKYDITWKARYPSANLYNIDPLNTLKDFVNEKLAPPSSPSATIPKVVLITGSNERFLLTGDDNDKRVSPEDFTRPLEYLSYILTTLGKGTFVVITMASNILYKKSFPRFNETLYMLLKSGLSVQLRKTYLPKHRIPQDRTIVALISSPCYDPAQLAFKPAPEPFTVRDICRNILMTNIKQNVYSHKTGIQVEDGLTLEAVDLGSRAVDLRPQLSHYHHLLGHPTRGDHLTVRELARLQGFPDNLIFLGDIQFQFRNVLRALPPHIANMLAKSVLTSVRALEVQQPSNESFRSSKRARFSS